MNLTQIRSPYDDAIRDEAFRRFGATRDGTEELEGSTPVYRTSSGGREIALKITPGFATGHAQVQGSTIEHIEAEVDFVRFLAESGLPVAAPLPSPSGSYMERI